MDLQDLKRWHWMAIGLLVGSLWAATQLFYGINPDGETTAGTFEMVVMTTPKAPAFVDRFDNGNVYVTALQIHPPTIDDGPAENAKEPAASRQIQWVTGNIARRRFKQDAREWQTRTFRYKATMPFVPNPKFDYVAQDWVPYGSFKKFKGYEKPTEKNYSSIRAYFDELNRKYGSGSMLYRYAWWESRWAVMTIYPIGGLLLIGGVWPVIISLLAGAGFGSTKKEESAGLSQYKGSRPAEISKPDQVTEKDRERLAAMNAELEKNLQNSASATTPKAGVMVDAAVRKLEGGSVEEAKKDIEDKAARAKAFGAGRTDFYPTEIHPEQKKE